MSGDKHIFLATQNAKTNDPKEEDIYVWNHMPYHPTSKAS
jgi:hypothetical protein